MTMTSYVFIESRDPFASHDTQFIWETATALQQRGHAVTVFLIQNGTLAARRNARRSSLPSLTKLAAAGIELLADDFSLRERGIAASELAEGIQEANIETLVDLLAQDTTKAIWH
jgi:sulfur relay (sulfurtransferase) DsrF/TusC family protein